MADSITPLEPEGFYHIYNHAVGNDLLFKSDRNYLFFLMKLQKYLNGYIMVYAYCLIPNHFHLLLKVKTEEEILAFHNPTRVQNLNPTRVQNLNPTRVQNLNPTRVQNPRRVEKIPLILSQRFSNMFNSYSQAYNKENNRKGSLFNNRFKRKVVEGDSYLIKLIQYIHCNPVNHGLVNTIDEWPYSSYLNILSKDETFLTRSKILELFDGIENFVSSHNNLSS